MAKKTYTLEQAAAKLGKSADEFKEFAKRNGVSELREGANILYKAADIDALAGAQADDTVLNIEDSVIGLNDESSLLGLESVDDLSDKDDEFEIDADMSSMVELTEADTRSGLTGLTDDTDEPSDTQDSILSLADSINTEEDSDDEARIDADADINAVGADGSGSGLLDLSLQADDSQFGAVLDDILPGGDGAEGGFNDIDDDVPSSGDDFAASDSDDEDYSDAEEVRIDAGSEPAPAPVATPVAAMETLSPAVPRGGYQPLAVDPASGVFGVAMLLPFLATIFALIVLVAGFKAITPSILMPIEDYIWYVFGGLAGLSLIIGIFGGLSGGEKKPKAAQPKAPKKAKKVKKKK